MARRYLVAIAGLALILHVVGICRTLLPAQDGLKFIRVARDFHHRALGRRRPRLRPAPALLGLHRPGRATGGLGIGGRSNLVESCGTARVSHSRPSRPSSPCSASPAPSSASARRCWRRSSTCCSPFPAAIGRDTLSDSLALLFFATSLRLGEVALRSGHRAAWIGTGLVAGVGYLVRPELLVVPMAVGITAVLPLAWGWMPRIARRVRCADVFDPADGQTSAQRTLRNLHAVLSNLAGLGLSALAVVGCYALVKGEVSEKLAIRTTSGMGPSSRGPIDRRDDAPWA